MICKNCGHEIILEGEYWVHKFQDEVSHKCEKIKEIVINDDNSFKIIKCVCFCCSPQTYMHREDDPV